MIQKDTPSIKDKIRFPYLFGIILLLITYFVSRNIFILIAFIIFSIFFGWIYIFIVIINKLNQKVSTIERRNDFISMSYVSIMLILFGSITVFGVREKIMTNNLNSGEGIALFLGNLIPFTLLFSGIILMLFLIKLYKKPPIVL